MGFRVIGVDHSSKKDLVMECGAEHFFGVDTSKDPVEDVKGVTGGFGVHAVIVVTANNKAYAQSVGMLRFGGKVMCVGIPEGTPEPIAGADPGSLVLKELKVEGTAVGNRKDAIECLDLAARGVIKMHYRMEKMENLSSVFNEMHAGKLQGRVVLDMTS